VGGAEKKGEGRDGKERGKREKCAVLKLPLKSPDRLTDNATVACTNSLGRIFVLRYGLIII